MKKPVLLLAFLAVLACGLALTASADSDTVTATVSPIVISVNVSTKLNGSNQPEQLDYGSVLVGSADAVPLSGSPLDVTNTGTVSEDFSIKGFNTQSWTLASTPGADQYVHKYSTSGTPGSFVAMTTSPTALTPNNVSPTGVVNVHLRMSLPTSTSATTTQNASVQILATQHTP